MNARPAPHVPSAQVNAVDRVTSAQLSALEIEKAPRRVLFYLGVIDLMLADEQWPAQRVSADVEEPAVAAQASVSQKLFAVTQHA
jgi:hypothetical protein